MAHETVEEQIRRHCESEDYARAATQLLEAYGPEILSLLFCRLRCEVNARDVFGMFCEDLWRALPRFEFRCSARTWAYVLARHAETRFRSEPQRRPDRNLPIGEELNQLVDRVRTSTAPYRDTQVIERLRLLRSRLAEQDELILLLRVDRGLSWRDIACVLATSESAAREADLEREAARLRQRFQVIKQRLRHWAEEEGLVGSAGREAAPAEQVPAGASLD
jgi:RNA polymerase sigma-70 factor (ECF subfamily)